jgi:hypothetical protein
MNRNSLLCGTSMALLVFVCLGAGMNGCASTSCEDNDACGDYPWPDACDGAECAETSVPDVGDAGTAMDADGGTDASRDVSADGVTDGDADATVRPDGRDDADARRDVGTDVPVDAITDVIVDTIGDAVADADVGPACDVTKSPVDEPCVVDDRYGVFVSPGGSDTAGVGTKAAPYKTVTKGLTSAQGKNVYVCAGNYAEAVTIEGALDGARIFGGFDCLGWSYAASNRPVVKPTTGPALTAKSLTKGLRVEDVEFDAPATTASGESSAAGWVTGSANVRLVRVKLVAAAAQAGADGVAASNYDTALQQTDPKIAGRNASGAAGGAAQACSMLCTNNVSSSGGKGGNGAPPSVGDGGIDGGSDAGAPTAGTDGGPAITPEDPPGATGAGGVPKTPMNASCTSGAAGSNAPPKPGGAGASQPGLLTANGWTRADGTTGTVGGPGQGGGGGGGGVFAAAGGGGGGGCGGCGGAGGPAGQSGGSSFALLSYQSTVTLDGCVLVAAAGGNGGKGADGQVGQLGGFGGDRSAPGCVGGNGGQGGQAGGGGGGAGGHSVALGYLGQAPTQTNGTTFQVASQPAAPGAAGNGGNPVATAGAVGKAQNVMALP